jgi:adenylate cyclase
LPVKLNTGALIAGVLGTHKFVYDVWGDTVNTAKRMESYGLPGRVHGSVATRRALGEAFRFEPRGALVIKGKGSMQTYFLYRQAQKPSGCCKSAGSEVCQRVERPLCVELLGANPT